MLLAFMIYNDGIQTIQKMAATYGKELGIADYGAHRVDSHRAVRGIPVRVPVRSDRRSHWCQADDLHRARRLCRHQRSRLLHADRGAFRAARCAWSRRCREEHRR